MELAVGMAVDTEYCRGYCPEDSVDISVQLVVDLLWGLPCTLPWGLPWILALGLPCRFPWMLPWLAVGLAVGPAVEGLSWNVPCLCYVVGSHAKSQGTFRGSAMAGGKPWALPWQVAASHGKSHGGAAVTGGLPRSLP